MLSSKSQSSQKLVQCPNCLVNHLPANGDLTNGIYAFTCGSCGNFVKFKAINDVQSTVTFTINQKIYTVGNEFDASTTLLTFLREKGVSTGTKGCCYEGGCGVCLVTVTLMDALQQGTAPYTVNSCCLPLYSCSGMTITTIEGLGNVKKLHALQDRLAKYDGAQCGFCSPGQVMNMNGILKKNPKPTMKEIEDDFDATICRCTGYRSILDAMKSFAMDAPSSLPGGPMDIEDFDGKICSKSGKACTGTCKTGDKRLTDQSVHIVSEGSRWLRPNSLDDLCKLLKQHKSDNYRLVFGNTGFGVYKELKPHNFDVLIDVRAVQEMYTVDFDPTIVLGANLSISSLAEILEKTGSDPTIQYGIPFAKHLRKVAMHGIRNLACWAGNIMLKHLHRDYPSDIFMLLETIGGKLIIYDGDGNNPEYSLPDFLDLDMSGRVIAAMAIPTFQSPTLQIRTFRTSLRLQACHSYVCSGFMFDIDPATNYTVKGKPSIVIEGISSKFIHATQTEAFLVGKQLGDPGILKAALQTLSSELIPDVVPMGGSPTFRKSLALSMFYKFVLGACKTKASALYASGGLDMDRALITGKREFDSNPAEFPVSKPMMKVTADYLTTGQVKFLDDLPMAPTQLCGALVLSTQACCTIDTVDTAEAEKVPGFVRVVRDSDIPAGGANNWRPLGIQEATDAEEVLCSGSVMFAGQPIAIVVAENETAAWLAASKVKVTYKNIQKPTVNLADAVAAKSFLPIPPDGPKPITKGDAKGAISSAPRHIAGSIACGDQYHMHMETQGAVCTPTDVGGMNVKATTQWLDGVLITVAQVLGLPEAAVTVETQRLGGAFGGKITQNWHVAGLTALAAHVLDRPVKIHLDIHTNMKMLGKRTPYIADYQVGFDDAGKLQGVEVTLYAETGYKLILLETSLGVQDWFDNAYYCPNWLWTPIAVKTDKVIHTACRAPGSVPFIFIMEAIMEHVAKSLGKDPLEVRKTNLYVKGQTTPAGQTLNYCSIKEVVAQLETDIGLDQRKVAVDTFNKTNRWKKRGLAVMPNRFGIGWTGAMYNTSIIIYHGDGSVAIAHGGIDCGQGINTKAAQVCALKLGIPMDKIRCKMSSTVINANSVTTGGSITSELVCKGVIEACATLVARLAPIKASMKNPTWEELVEEAWNNQVDMIASYMTAPDDKFPAHYSCYSAACVEAEVDVLTGQYQLRQMDMLYDCGQSMNPELDMGQVEGGFVMGLGYFLQEKMVYNEKTGEAMNSGTWDYKPPMGKDLPMSFNIKFQKNAPNPLGVLSSKASGEPPVALAAVALFAIKHAVEAARADAGNTDYFPLNAPATVEVVQTLCLNNTDQFTYGN